MEGIFLKNKFSLVFNLLGIISGIFLMAMFPFLIIVDDSATIDVYFGLAFFSIFGFIVVAISVISLLFNSKAYLHLNNNEISARFSWGTKLICNYSEIAFCEYGFNSLTVRLKNGKRYMIFSIANCAEICTEIRKKIHVSNDNVYSPQTLLEEIDEIKLLRRKWIFLTVSFGVLMFVAILLTVILTSEKEMWEFGKTDWIFFGSFVVFETIDIAVTFFFANKCGRLNPVIVEKSTILRKQILENAPRPSGNLIKVYIDSDYSARFVVLGYPNADDIYFIVQCVDKKYNIITTHSSEIFSNIKEIEPMLDELIEIT